MRPPCRRPQPEGLSHRLPRQFSWHKRWHCRRHQSWPANGVGGSGPSCRWRSPEFPGV